VAVGLVRLNAISRSMFGQVSWEVFRSYLVLTSLRESWDYDNSNYP